MLHSWLKGVSDHRLKGIIGNTSYVVYLVIIEVE